MGQIANQMAFEIFYKVKEKKRNKSGKKAEKRPIDWRKKDEMISLGFYGSTGIFRGINNDGFF